VARASAPGELPRSATSAATRLEEHEQLGDDSVDVEFSLSGARRPRSKALMGFAVAGVVALGVGVGGLLAFRGADRPEAPAVAPSAPVQAAPQPVAPPAPVVTVRFEVASEPPGATVTRDGAVLGITPLSLPVARQGSSPARVALGLTLDGYERASVTAEGLEGSVPVRQVLSKRAEAPQVHRPPPPAVPAPKKKQTPTNPPGYKDDPYQ
jgi:serine/threonine-protein kinase